MGELVRGLKQLEITPATLSWLQHAVVESDTTETGAREQALKQLKTECDRLRTRIETMCLDRLDGRITPAFFDEKSKEWRDQEKQIEARMTQLQTSKVRSAAEAVQILRSVSDARATFEDKQPQEQRAIALLMQKATWQAGKFESTQKHHTQN